MSGFKDAQFHEAIELIYQFASHEYGIQHFLDFLVEELGYHGSTLTIHNTDNLQVQQRITAGVNSVPEYLSEYKQKDIGNHDVWSQALIKQTETARFVADHNFVPRPTFEKSVLCQWVKPYDVHAAAGAHWQLPANRTLRVAFQKNKTAGLVSDDEVAVFNSLSSHLTRAIKLKNKLDFSELKSQIFERVEHSQQCLAILSSKGEVLAFNATFEQFMQQKPYVKEKNKKLVFSQLDAQQNYASYLAQVDNQFLHAPVEHSFTLCSQDLDADFTCKLLPMLVQDCRFNIGLKSVLLLTIEPEYLRLTDKKEQLIVKTDLTCTELEVCFLLSKGLSIKDVAATQFKSEHTIRTHVKNIQRKLGVSSQAAVVAKMFTI